MQEPQETQVPPLGQEDPLEKEMATQSSIIARKISWEKGAWRATVDRVTKNRTQLSTHTFSALVSSQGNYPTPLWGRSVVGSTHPQSTRAAGSLLPCYSTQSLFGDLTFKVIQQCRTRTSSHQC